MKPAQSKIHKATVALQRLMADVTQSFLEMGAILHDILENKEYLKYGETTPTFNDYLKEIRMGRSTAYNCISIYVKFGTALAEKKAAVDYTRLTKALPYVKTQEQAEEWVTKAEELPPRAFDDAIIEAKGGTPSDACAHTEVEMWCKCLKCGKFLKDAPMVDAAAEA